MPLVLVRRARSRLRAVEQNSLNKQAGRTPLGYECAAASTQQPGRTIGNCLRIVTRVPPVYCLFRLWLNKFSYFRGKKTLLTA